MGHNVWHGEEVEGSWSRYQKCCWWYSPDSHSRLHVILLDFVMTDVNRSGVFGVIRLGGYMLSCLVVGVEVVDRLGIANEFEYFSDMFACLISPT